jgi:dipeptidase E
MGKIVAIGGGEIKDLETLPLDKEIIRLTGKRHPRALFIPTASGDAEGYWKTFQEVYGKKLGCRTNVLYLIREKLTPKQIENKILSSDLVYVGGGNTLRMMKTWRKRGVDTLFRKAYRKGIVLSGLSAGSLCWFRYGHSDSVKFSNPKNWKYIRVSGLGFINAINCPHYSNKEREKDFQKMVGKYGGTGIALSGNCAMEIVDGKYRVITSRKDAKAFRVYKKGGKVFQEIIPQKKGFAPLSRLLPD